MRTLCLFLLITGLLAGGLAIVVRSGTDSEPRLSECFSPSPRAPQRETERAPAPAPIIQRRDPERKAVPPWARLEHPTYVEKYVDMLARARSSEPGPVQLGRSRPEGVLLRPWDAGEMRRVTITPFPEGLDRDGVSFEVVPDRSREWSGRFARAPFPELSLEPGDYVVRVDGKPCVPSGSVDWLLVLDLAEAPPIGLCESSNGDPITYTRSRWYRPEEAGYVADDGVVLTRAQVNELRARVLASRPKPGESVHEILAQPDDYLASLGITDDVIARRLATIRAACVHVDWTDPDGNAPEIPAELDELFALDALKRHLVGYLLREPGENWALSLELPGEPWIHLCTSSNAPDALPWYVAVEGERWYALDRELSWAVLELAPADGWMRGRLEEQRGWRETIWSMPWIWGDIPKRVNEALAQLSYQRLPGWAELEGRFQLENASLRPTARPALPFGSLSVTRPGTIDVVHLDPDWADHSSWTDVVAAYERAERAATSQPWLASWKEKNRGRIGVIFPTGIDPLERLASVAAEAWEDAGMGGAPEFALRFARPIRVPDGGTKDWGCGLGVLSAKGDLLILESDSPSGPLASEGLRDSRIDRTQRYGVVRPGSAPEIRTRADRPSPR